MMKTLKIASTNTNKHQLDSHTHDDEDTHPDISTKKLVIPVIER
jgi:hypothetical protein